MSWAFVVWCVASIAFVSALTSLCLYAFWPAVQTFATPLAPHPRSRVYFVIGALPLLLGGATVYAALLPSLNPLTDHCLNHADPHAHLCPTHLDAAPGWVLTIVAAAALLRLGSSLAVAGRDLWLNYKTSRTLRQGCEPNNGLYVFEDDEPQAFVLGIVRPRIHASSGLLALSEAVVKPVIAHESEHARARHGGFRLLFASLLAGHLPQLAAALRHEFAQAQEMTADEVAAQRHGRLAVAEALLKLARGQQHALGILFTHGPVEARVRALLNPVTPASG